MAGLIGDNKEEVGGAEQKKPDTKRRSAQQGSIAQKQLVYGSRDVDKPYKKRLSYKGVAVDRWPARGECGDPALVVDVGRGRARRTVTAGGSWRRLGGWMRCTGNCISRFKVNLWNGEYWQFICIIYKLIPINPSHEYLTSVEICSSPICKPQ